MGNIFTQDPIILDTVWTNSTYPAAMTDITLFNQSFRRVVWVNPAAAADVVTITDNGGAVILSGVCAVAHQDVVLWDAGNTRKTLLLKQNKWILSVLGSGKLYMYR